MTSESARSTYSPIEDRDVFDIENSFYLRSEPYRLGKLLGQYEIYKNILNIPGAIVECGTFKGVSLTRFATFRHAMETAESRKIISFDAFGDFPSSGLDRKDDIDFATTHDQQSGGPGISAAKLTALFEAKGFRNFELVPGDVNNTLKKYFEKNAYEKIALLHLDMDVYAPTALALNLLYDRVVPGGVIMIDDYGAVSGANDAVDQFIAGKNLRIQKSLYYKVPAYIIKP
jgi:hypothetical protein